MIYTFPHLPRLLICSFLFTITTITCWGQGQFYFQSGTSPEFVEGDVTYNSAFTGGFHKPRFANLDVNLDGNEDLVVYDFEDDRTMVFLGDGNTENPDYTFSPDHEVLIPALDVWIITKDFNNDGKKDIFTANTIGGVMVYKNVSTDSELKFTVYNDDLKHFDSDLNFYTAVYSSPADMPVVDDIDGDGDLDFLSFDPLGSSIAFYRNNSVDDYGHRDSFNFRVATYCWGRFEEAGNSNDIIFAPKCFLFKKKKHAGSNMATIDIDGDGDKELLLSDVIYKTVLLIENGRDPKTNGHNRDTMIGYDKNFPSGTKAVDVDLFPTINQVDVNFDGVIDMVCAPSSQEYNFIPENTWYYKNNGKNDLPDFEFVSDDFIQSQTIELGEYTYPAFHDVDADGDMDLFVASPTPYTDSKYDEAYFRLFLYENIGDASTARFELADQDYLNLTQLKQAHFSPSFGDADNDGTIDLLLSTDKGKIFHYANNNMPNMPSSFTQASIRFMDIKYERQISACVADVNQDGKNDLVVGKVDGKLAYYEWKGTTLELVTENWGGIDVGLPGSGFAIPRVMDFDNDNQLDLLVSDNIGYLHYYDNIDYTSTQFVRTKEMVYNAFNRNVYNKDFGLFLSVAAADINNDSLVDLVMGNKRGGLMYLEGVEDAPVGVFNEGSNDLQFSIYPNPAVHQLTLSWKNGPKMADYRIVNMKGQMVSTGRISNGHVLSIEELPAGNYAALLYLQNGTVYGQKVMISKN